MIRKIIFAISFIFILLLPSYFSVKAAENDPSISPAIINLSLKPGESKQSSYTFFNDSDQDITISVDTRAFWPSNGEHGAPIFQTTDGKKYTSEITDWIKIPKTNYDVPKNSNIEINFETDIPSDAKPGKYFAAIFNVEGSAGTKSGSLIKKEIGVTLVTEVLPLSQNEILSRNSNGLRWILYVGIIIIIVAVFVLIFLRLKKKNKIKFNWIKRKGGKHG